MMTLRPDPAALRGAATSVEAANAADAVALESARKHADDKAAADKADAEAAIALRAAGVGSGVASTTPTAPTEPAPGSVTVTKEAKASWCGCNPWVWIGAIAAIAVIALLLSFWGVISSFYLANTKASEARVDGVALIATNAGNTAAEVKGKVDVMAGNLRDATTAAADAKAKASEAVTKADAASAKADAADTKATKALGFAHKHRPQPKPAVKPVASAPTASAPVVAHADLWKWRFPDSSTQNPKVCVVERLTGEPKPDFCSELRVEAPQGAETRESWRARVTAKMGLTNPRTF